jgi:hypothetical protein
MNIDPETNECLLFTHDRVGTGGFLGKATMRGSADTEFPRRFFGNELAAGRRWS